MKKVLIFLMLIFIGALLGGIYGILHDQISYSIAPEYYTKFKFYQFEVVDESIDVSAVKHPRIWVGVVGFLATWWMGAFIGLMLGAIGFTHEGWKTMLNVSLRSFGITIPVTAFVGLVGLFYGFLFLANQPRHAFVGWFIPDDLVDFKNFIAVGSMHDASYIGGMTGMVAGAVYSLWKKQQVRKNRVYKILWTKDKSKK